MHPYFFDLPDHRADDLAPRLRVRGLPDGVIRSDELEFAARAPAKHPPPAGAPQKAQAPRRGGFTFRLFRRRGMAPA